MRCVSRNPAKMHFSSPQVIVRLRQGSTGDHRAEGSRTDRGVGPPRDHRSAAPRGRAQQRRRTRETTRRPRPLSFGSEATSWPEEKRRTLPPDQPRCSPKRARRGGRLRAEPWRGPRRFRRTRCARIRFSDVSDATGIATARDASTPPEVSAEILNDSSGRSRDRTCDFVRVKDALYR